MSITITNNKANLIDSILSNARIRIGGSFIFAKARGTYRIRVVNGTGIEVIQFSDILFVPNILVNLISTTRLKKKGLFYYIEKDYLYTRIYNDKRILADVIERNNLPQLKVVDSNTLVTLTKSALHLSKTVTLTATTEV